MTPRHTFIRLHERHEMRREAQDWLYGVLCAAVLTALLLGAVAGHAYISAGVQ